MIGRKVDYPLDVPSGAFGIERVCDFLLPSPYWSRRDASGREGLGSQTRRGEVRAGGDGK